jgi:hypothetical protein
MADNPKYDGPGIANQPTHPHQRWVHILPQSGKWVGEWEVQSNLALVQAENRKDRFNSDVTGKPLAR